MIQNSLFYKVVKGFFIRLMYVNLIGFVIGLFISGTDIFTFWKIYLLYSSVIGLTLWFGNEYFSRIIDKKYSWLEYPLKKLVLRVVFSLIYSSVVMVILYMSIWFFIYHKPNLNNFFSYNRISFLIFYACTVIVMLIFHTINFFRAWQRAALSEEKLKKESIAFQLQALRNQVDPHFLFNSLNTLTTLIETDTQKATTFVKQLSDMFRYMLDKDSKEMIDIDSELKFVHAYIFLQQMRFGENLKVEDKIKDNDFYVLPISLQLLIENAIKHNEISDEFPLLITIDEEDDYVLVKNKIQPKILETPSKGIGLSNLQVRYKFFTNQPLVLETTPESFSVKLPKLKI